MVGAIRQLLALPLVLLGRLLGILAAPYAAAAYRAAWAVGGDGGNAALALQAIEAHFGPEAATAAALAWMDRRPRPQIAAFAGLLALKQDDRQSAAQWLDRGRQVGQDALGSLELLEFLLAMLSGPEAASRLAGQFAERRDLAPGVSRLVVTRLMWDDLLAGRCDDAARRAHRLLSIEDNRDAACILWALEYQRGNPRAAEASLRRAGPVTPEWMLYFQVHAAAAAGRKEHSHQLLAELAELDAEMAQAARDNLGERQAEP